MMHVYVYFLRSDHPCRSLRCYTCNWNLYILTLQSHMINKSRCQIIYRHGKIKNIDLNSTDLVEVLHTVEG